MGSIRSIAGAAMLAIGALAVGGTASQAAAIPSGVAVVGHDTLVQKTHGFHRRWRRGHRHGRRWRRWRRGHNHRHCHWRPGGFSICHWHWHRRYHHH